MTKRIATAAVLLALGIPAVAQARPELSLTKADQLAGRLVIEDASESYPELREEEEAAGEAGDLNEPSITGYAIYPCDRETAYRALCDYTESYSDGVSCDYTLTIIQGHRDHLIVRWPDEESCYPS